MRPVVFFNLTEHRAFKNPYTWNQTSTLPQEAQNTIVSRNHNGQRYSSPSIPRNAKIRVDKRFEKQHGSPSCKSTITRVKWTGWLTKAMSLLADQMTFMLPKVNDIVRRAAAWRLDACLADAANQTAADFTAVLAHAKSICECELSSPPPPGAPHHPWIVERFVIGIWWSAVPWGLAT